MSDDAFTLLVVEDDEATRTFLADNLTADGFDLLVADCAREGLRMIERKFPDLVLVDVNLPDLSGLDLISQVRGADLAAGRVEAATPMVVLSGRSAELDLLRGFERGADDYVIKLPESDRLRVIAARLSAANLVRGSNPSMASGRMTGRSHRRSSCCSAGRLRLGASTAASPGA